MTTSPLTLVMPTISWEEPFATCLRASLAALGPADQALVVFDGEPPPPPEWLLHSSVRLLSTGRRSGPAAARNLAAREARGEILWFVDADVQVHPDAAHRIREHFADNPELAAVFGSYDDTPAAPGLVSRFRNLLHHHTHHRQPGPASTFWAGCGAVRRQVFLDLGGFDAVSYDRPCIEDIEFGLRLSDAGRKILLDPTIQGTHHKRWTLRSMVSTDIRQRAIPWSQLLLSRRELPTTLNLDPAARLSAAASLLLSLALLAAASMPELGPLALSLAGGCLGLLLLINRSLLALLWRQGGLRLSAAGTGLLILYFLYSSLSFATVALAAVANAPLQTPCWLQERPNLQRILAKASLTLLALIGLATVIQGLVLHAVLQSGLDLHQRFDEWRLFSDRIYPSSQLADPAARSLPYFRTTVYLPWALPLFGALFGWGGLFGGEGLVQGKLLISTASLASLSLIAGVGWHALRPLGRQAGWLGLLIPLAIRGNARSLAQGQFSILCMGLISLQWGLQERRRPVAAGLCWALAMLKPQIALPFALPLLQRSNRIGLAAGSGLLLALSAVALLHTHTNPWLLTIRWFQVLPSFQGVGNANALAALWPLLASKQTAVMATGLLMIVGLGFAISQRRFKLREASRACASRVGSLLRADPLELAGLCSVVGLVGFYHINYDNIMLFPALLALWRTTLRQPRWGNLLITLAMSLSVWLPQTPLNAVPGITGLQALIWSVGGAWLGLPLLARSGHGTEPSTIMAKRLRPAS
jgi:GT2 family glycosyltransferase